VARARDAGVRVVAPLVSRHFDFLDDLTAGGKLPVARGALRGAASSPHVTMLLGSAPVGRATVERLQRLCGALPTVRFGSTETCLQVVGTPIGRPAAATLASFEAGWQHAHGGEVQVGYYIGRPHSPFTEVDVVRSTQRGSPDFLKPCAQGEPGFLIARGANVMTGYVADDKATAAALDDTTGWYLNLGDVCFWLSPSDTSLEGAEAAAAQGAVRDYYWLSRESTMLIRGGANYAYEQVGGELLAFVHKACGLEAADVAVEVVGLRIRSEHEDECCVAVELRTDAARARASEVGAALAGEARKGAVSKGAKPDRIAINAISVPRNFKGAVLHKDLAKLWKDLIAQDAAFGVQPALADSKG